MADMFGAPIGIGAAETDIRQNVLGALQAGKILGEIEAQPADLELKKAHARLYSAEAGSKEMEYAQQKKLMELMATPGAQGSNAEDPATRMDKIGNLMLDSGLFVKGSKMLEDASQIRGRAATAASAVIRQTLMTDRSKRLKAERVGSLAGSATAATWPAVRAQLSEAMDGAELPEDFSQAQQFLPQLAQAGMTAAQQLSLKEKQTDNVAKAAHWKEQEVEWGSRITRANATVKLINERIARMQKDGGDVSTLLKERIKTEKARREAIEGKEQAQRNKSATPPLPEDRKLGAVYNTPRGPMTWQGSGWLPAPASSRAAEDALDDELLRESADGGGDE